MYVSSGESPTFFPNVTRTMSWGVPSIESSGRASYRAPGSARTPVSAQKRGLGRLREAGAIHARSPVHAKRASTGRASSYAPTAKRSW